MTTAHTKNGAPPIDAAVERREMAESHEASDSTDTLPSVRARTSPPRWMTRLPGVPSARPLRSLVTSFGKINPIPPFRPAPIAPAGLDERRRLERDLHDLVQNELVALIVKLSLIEQDPNTPPALAHALSGLEARAQAVLDSVRAIARGIYPHLLADLGVMEALRAQAKRAPIKVNLSGAAPRSTDQAEAAVYFSCSEAIQNAVKHAGRAAPARADIRLHHANGTLAVRIEDDGRGFDPARTPHGTGLGNVRDRIRARGGSVKLTSEPGNGTTLTFSLPWPTRQSPYKQNDCHPPKGRLAAIPLVKALDSAIR